MFYQERITFLDRILATVGMWICLTAFLPLFAGGGGASGEDETGSPVFLIVMALLYLVVGLRVMTQLPSFLALLKLSPVNMALAVLALVSVIWSLSPQITAVRGVAIIGTTLLGMYLAITFPPKELLKCIGVSFVLTCLGSLLSIYLMPSYGVHHDDLFAGVPRGVFPHKNVFGPRMSFIALYFAVLATQKEWPHKKLNYLFLFVAIFLVIISESREAWVVTFAGLTVLFFFRSGRRLRIALSFVYIASGIFLLVFISQIFQAMGRDLTFTGRTYIWVESLKYIMMKPFLGYGFGVFWSPFLEPARQISTALGYIVSHAHNGIIEVLLGLGGVGLVLFAYSLIRSLGNFKYFEKQSAEKTFFIVFFVYLILMNLADSALLTQNTIYWLFFVVFSSYGAILKTGSEDKEENKYAKRFVINHTDGDSGRPEGDDATRPRIGKKRVERKMRNFVR